VTGKGFLNPGQKYFETESNWVGLGEKCSETRLTQSRIF
jgi:hypothetical protein